MIILEWQSLDYTSPGAWRPFQLCRRIGHRLVRITLPIDRAITRAEIELYDFWRPV